MSKMNRWMAMAGVAAVTCLGMGNALAQNGGGNRGNWDPAQMQQRMMERTKEMLEVTNDDEWAALQPLVQKVMDLRRESMAGMGRGFFRQRGGGGGDQGGDQGGQQRRMFGTSSPEADALQKAIDAKAPKAELKAALDKYAAYRKDKQAQLEKAQADLRKVLTSRQEAIAALNGLL